jgi:hypothetical protein
MDEQADAAPGRSNCAQSGGHAPGLPVLQAAGFSAHLDACAWEPPQTQPGEPGHPGDESTARHAQLWFVSLLGAQQAVKALWARLVKGERATLRLPAAGGLERVQFCALARTSSGGPVSWRFFSAGLPAAAGHHGAVVPAIALYACERADFLLLPRTPAEAADLHLRFLNRRLHLPLHAAWAPWLWERALRTGEAIELQAHGVLAYRCAPDADAIATSVSTGIGSGRLRVPPGP